MIMKYVDKKMMLTSTFFKYNCQIIQKMNSINLKIPLGDGIPHLTGI